MMEKEKYAGEIPEVRLCSTIREILVGSEETYGSLDAVRFKAGKDTVASRSYTQLRHDSESFSRALSALLPERAHVALTGLTSYYGAYLRGPLRRRRGRGGAGHQAGPPHPLLPVHGL